MIRTRSVGGGAVPLLPVSQGRGKSRASYLALVFRCLLGAFAATCVIYSFYIVLSASGAPGADADSDRFVGTGEGEGLEELFAKHTSHHEQVAATAHTLKDSSVKAGQAGPSGLYALSARDINNHDRQLAEFAGKVLIVVNVASACGFTNENYKGLVTLYSKYRPLGLEILAFPCNQFGHQEPKGEAEISAFCSSHYNVTFPLFAKVEVNGPNTHPVYAFLKRELPVASGGGGGVGPGQDLSWNFQKILVDRSGHPVKRLYQSFDLAVLESDILGLLEAKASSGDVPVLPAKSR